MNKTMNKDKAYIVVKKILVTSFKNGKKKLKQLYKVFTLQICF